MPNCKESQVLSAQTRILVERKGRGGAQRDIRRVYLFDRSSGLLLEPQVAFIDLEFPTESVNTHVAVAADLAFFLDWCGLRKQRNPSWVAPERRAANARIALSQGEIKDLARWCQVTADSLSEAMAEVASASNLEALPAGPAVEPQLRNRRLRTICRYLEWLTTSLANPLGQPDFDVATLGEVNRAFLHREFSKRLVATPVGSPPLALSPEQSKALHQGLEDMSLFGRTACGRRDSLVTQLLLQGLRAGEVLKLRVTDFDDQFSLRIGKQIGVVSVIRRPNDSEDERVHEPAVKTREGDVAIPRRLAIALIDYVCGCRRDSVSARKGERETPYLFVCHSGATVGGPISQRNLNRIVAKLKVRLELPEIAPHVLRHTHMTEIHEVARLKGRSDRRIRDLLLARGRWSPNSDMPAHYTHRTLMEESAELVEERDARLGQK